MGLFYSKPDENYKQIVDLPNEIMEEIFSYINKKERMNIALVSKSWFAIINSKIEEILIQTPTQENLQQVRTLINRFPNLKNMDFNVELATEVIHCLDFLPLTSLAFFGIQLEFVIKKSWQRPLEGLLIDLRSHEDANPESHISRIRINLEDFNFKCHPSQVITFEIDQSHDFEKLKEDIMSFNCVTKIDYTEWVHSEQDNLKFAKIVSCILTRKQLKQVGFNVFFDSNFDYENKFPTNLTVDEITLRFRCEDLSSNIWSKVFDALPNIKIVRVVTDYDWVIIGNVVEMLKNLIGAFKGLKSLHFAWIASDGEKFDSQKIQDCYNFIKENFPLKAKVIIATYESQQSFEDDVLTILIKKEQAIPPKIVPHGSPGSIITWTDQDYDKFKRL